MPSLWWQQLRRIATLAVVACLTVARSSGAGQCPPEGDTPDSLEAKLNRLKNRIEQPSQPISITIGSLLSEGDDYERWNNRLAATVEGYVVGVRTGPPESCNCHARAESGRDTHIELATEPGETRGWRLVISEVTPKWRDKMRGKALDWSTDGLKQTILGRRVRVTGWLFFDTEHAGDARNTAPPRRGNARGTAWEIHPVTAIQFVN